MLGFICKTIFTLYTLVETNLYKGEDNSVSKVDHVCLVESSTCVYKGTFINEKASPVVATKGCPGQDPGITEISFKCQSVSGILFISDVNGTTTQPERPTEGQIVDIVIDFYNRSTSNSFTRQTPVNFPENGFVMDIVIIYDDAFRNDRHSGSDSDAITEINAVMAHVQTFFNLKVN